MALQTEILSNETYSKVIKVCNPIVHLDKQ